ncbi:MAG TPA: hypothetical protein VGN42_12695 [Pirellulales bacterium]|nr:hypothetical protein [Pirellulales bacterium]
MKDEHSTSDDESEPPRPRTIPDDFRWDPKMQAWFAAGEPGMDFMRDWWPEVLRRTEEEFGPDNHARSGPPCFTLEELRPAGALDRPPELRKSRRNKRDRGRDLQRELFSGLEEDDAPAEKPSPAPPDPDGDAPAES